MGTPYMGSLQDLFEDLNLCSLSTVLQETNWQHGLAFLGCSCSLLCKQSEKRNLFLMGVKALQKSETFKNVRTGHIRIASFKDGADSFCA